MEGKIALREASLDDSESLVAVQVASPGAAAWTAAEYASLLAGETTIGLLAEDRVWERAVGFLLARIVADEMEILNLAVDPAYRRAGIARRLLGHTLARAQGRGIGMCWLEVRASNQTARDFYQALGFVESHRRWRYYRDPIEDAVVCVRSLPPAGPAP